MFNKNYLLLLLGLFFKIGYAQTTTNLQVSLKNPLNNATVQSMQSFRLKAMVVNKGPNDLLASDSLAMYLVMDGDSFMFFNGSQIENFRAIAIDGIKSQDSFLINMPFAFSNSFDHQSIQFCLFIKPLNRSTKAIRDNDLSDNAACVQINVVPVNSSVNTIEKAVPFYLYPNPVIHYFNVLADFDYTQLWLLDAYGKRIDLPFSANNLYDCTAYNNGMYTLVASNGVQTMQAVLIIQK